MLIDVTASGSRVCEPTVMTSLSVRVDDGVDIDAALGDLGTMADGGGHVWLSIEVLRRRAAALVAPTEVDGWTAGFEAMVGYAASKGWTSPEGSHLRAHIEPAG